MRDCIVVEALGHPEVKENRTLIRLNHETKLEKLILNSIDKNVFFYIIYPLSKTNDKDKQPRANASKFIIIYI